MYVVASSCCENKTYSGRRHGEIVETGTQNPHKRIKWPQSAARIGDKGNIEQLRMCSRLPQNSCTVADCTCESNQNHQLHSPTDQKESGSSAKSNKPTKGLKTKSKFYGLRKPEAGSAGDSHWCTQESYYYGNANLPCLQHSPRSRLWLFSKPQNA